MVLTPYVRATYVHVVVDDYRKRLGRRMERAAQRAGFKTQAEFARALGVSEKQVNRWFKGRIEPNPASKNKIQNVLGVPFESLYLPDEDDEAEPEPRAA